jgi:hypothetical protein
MRLVLLLTFFLTYFASIGQVADTTVSVFEYILQNEVEEVFLKTDMKKLRKGKFDEELQPAKLSFLVNDSTKLNFDIQVRARGNMRKKACFHTPFKIIFSKSDLEAKGFNDTDEYKLVCQCNSGKSGEQWLLKEYLAYKLDNIVTDNSFRVHLFKINYFDTSKKKKQKQIRYAFIIENLDELAERLNGVKVELDASNIKKIKRENIVELGLFEYMIGNTDYSVEHNHNLKAVQVDETNSTIVIAYDFDSSGLVGTKYALPHPEMPIKDVKVRWFNLKGCNEKDVTEQIEHFKGHKEEIMDYCRNYTVLSKKSYAEVLKYISEFFEIIENPRSVSDQFVR